MKTQRNPYLQRLSVLALTLVLFTACGGGGKESAPGSAPLDTAARIAATQQTASSNPDCQSISPFYYEIGDTSSAIVSGTIGNGVAADTPMNIASASKWLFGAYVAEVRSGVLTSSDLQATNMRSGYASMGSFCLPGETVSECFTRGENETFSPAKVDRFNYDSGHFQKWGVDNGLATMTGPEVAAEYQTRLGSDIAVNFNGPLLAGGAIMSAEGYAAFLKKILNRQLQIAQLLGFAKICTLPGICSTADYSPSPEAWNYSIGHWVEDDPVSGDGSFSSAGAFGFYPWIDSSQTYYGVVARQSVAGTGIDSALCGRKLRKAFLTGIAQ